MFSKLIYMAILFFSFLSYTTTSSSIIESARTIIGTIINPAFAYEMIASGMVDTKNNFLYTILGIEDRGSLKQKLKSLEQETLLAESLYQKHQKALNLHKKKIELLKNNLQSAEETSKQIDESLEKTLKQITLDWSLYKLNEEISPFSLKLNKQISLIQQHSFIESDAQKLQNKLKQTLPALLSLEYKKNILDNELQKIEKECEIKKKELEKENIALEIHENITNTLDDLEQNKKEILYNLEKINQNLTLIKKPLMVGQKLQYIYQEKYEQIENIFKKSWESIPSDKQIDIYQLEKNGKKLKRKLAFLKQQEETINAKLQQDEAVLLQIANSVTELAAMLKN
ncbi:MAG: hypothetical protein WA432_02150 [Candidatus Babeliaceae bacterium]